MHWLTDHLAPHLPVLLLLCVGKGVQLVCQGGQGQIHPTDMMLVNGVVALASDLLHCLMRWLMR